VCHDSLIKRFFSLDAIKIIWYNIIVILFKNILFLSVACVIVMILANLYFTLTTGKKHFDPNLAFYEISNNF